MSCRSSIAVLVGVIVLVSATVEAARVNVVLQARVHVQIALPPTGKAVVIRCSEGEGEIEIGAGYGYEWDVDFHRHDTCIAIWGKSSANWDAYNPDTDEGHTLVYLSARLDGWYRSYDHTNWVKVTDWKGSHNSNST